MSTNNLDPVAVFVVASAAVFSPEVASIIGPYMLILLCSLIGAYIRVGQPGQLSNTKIFRLMVTSVLLSLAITVPSAQALQLVFPKLEAVDWLFGPIALTISIIGDRLPKVLGALLKKLFPWFDADVLSTVNEPPAINTPTKVTSKAKAPSNPQMNKGGK